MQAVKQSMPLLRLQSEDPTVRNVAGFFFSLQQESQSVAMGKCTAVAEGTVNFSVDLTV